MTSMARKLDQFYTDSAVAARLTQHLLDCLPPAPPGRPRLFLEPSAGAGAFVEAVLDALPQAQLYACDIDPCHPEVEAGDFFELYKDWASKKEQGQWVVLGNPPFGKNAALAVKFFNHAAQFADFIAFIVPRTFEKASLQNRLAPCMEILREEPMDANSFHFEGEQVAVPCVFQVWRRLDADVTRPRILTPTTHPDFRFLTSAQGADFAFQRVGVQAGRVKDLDASNLAPPSHYFMACNPGVDKEKVRRVLQATDWGPIKWRTAGNPSISKAELIAAYNQGNTSS